MNSPVVNKMRCPNPNKKGTRVWNRNKILYIGTREGVDFSPLAGDINSNYEHGLFGNIEVPDITVLANKVATLSKNGNNIYHCVVSLSEADATELGYTSKQKWSDLLHSTMPDIAKEFGIPITSLEWIGALHMEAGHPHCHYMFWNSDKKVCTNFIHTSSQHKCRMILSKEIAQEERRLAVINKTASRDALLEFGKDILKAETSVLRSPIPPQHINAKQVSSISSALTELIPLLPKTGRLSYKLLSPEAKESVDSVTKTLLQIPYVQKEYTKYIELNAQISRTYSPSKYRLQLNRTKAQEDIYKRLGNQVLYSCKQILRQDSHMQYEAALQAAIVRSSAFQLILSSFRSLSAQNNRQNLWHDENLQSHSKENLKVIAKKQMEHSNEEAPEKRAFQVLCKQKKLI